MSPATFLQMQAANARSLALELRAACLITEAVLMEFRAERLDDEATRLEMPARIEWIPSRDTHSEIIAWCERQYAKRMGI